MTEEDPEHVLIQIKKHGVTDSNIHQLLNMDANRACSEVGAAINQAQYFCTLVTNVTGTADAGQQLER